MTIFYPAPVGVLQYNTESDDSFQEDPLWLQRDKEKVYLREIKKDLVIKNTWKLSIYWIYNIWANGNY